MKSSLFPILLGPTIFVLLLVLGAPTGMPQSAYGILAATIWIAIWWVSEAIPIPITSLLPIVLFPWVSEMDLNEVTEPYANAILFLFIGGFILALAMEKWNLHRRMALTVISWVGTNMRQIILGFVIATGFLSMWISNTATTMMMLPIAVSIITQFKTFHQEQNLTSLETEDFGKALVLSIAYSASIGGMATLVGTPTNLIFAQYVKETYGVQISFAQWFWIGLPISGLLLIACWWLMTKYAFHLRSEPIPESQSLITQQLQSLGNISMEEKWVLGIFTMVALAWISSSYLITPFFPKVNDTNIALVGALCLFVIPSKNRKGEKLMDWQTTLKLPWGVLLLFGGAFAVAAGFKDSGLTQWIGEQLAILKGVPIWIVLLVIVTVVNFLTEITQNMATCSLMMPIVAALAIAINVHPYSLMVGTCIAASCAFMLPMSTAPNAIIFGSGLFTMKDMARTGFFLNIIAIIIITFVIYFILPIFWQIDLLSYPF